MKDNNAVYDFQKQNRARTAGMLRGAATVYLIYLAWTIVRDTLNGSSTLPGWVAWLSAAVFGIGGAVFGLYAWKTYRRDLEEALLPDEEEETDGVEDEVEDPDPATSKEDTP